VADEELAVSDGEAAVTQPDPNEPDPNVNDADPIEAVAIEMGWNPNFEGDGKKSAREYILASKDITKSLKSELRGVRDEVQRIGRTSAQLLEDKLAERDAEWRARHRQAVKDGDEELADQLVTQRDKIVTTLPKNDGPDPTVAQWVADNPWFNSDPAARAVAQAVSSQNANLSVSEQLKAAREAVHKRFPEYAPQQHKPPASVSTATSRAATTQKRDKGFNDMPSASQEMARDMLKRHGIPLETTAKSYWQDQNRRVG
jgi:hypothetical protein